MNVHTEHTHRRLGTAQPAILQRKTLLAMEKAAAAQAQLDAEAAAEDARARRAAEVATRGAMQRAAGAWSHLHAGVRCQLVGVGVRCRSLAFAAVFCRLLSFVLLCVFLFVVHVCIGYGSDVADVQRYG